MTILTFILSLCLGFCLTDAKEAETIRSIQYVYTDLSGFELASGTDAVSDIDYTITEILTFADDDGVITTRQTVYDIPVLADSTYRDWQFAVNLIANERGVTIKEFNDNTAIGVINEERLEAYKDLIDGYVSDIDSFDYLDERELQEQETRYTAMFVSFGLFYMSANMLTKIFAYWLKPKNDKKGV